MCDRSAFDGSVPSIQENDESSEKLRGGNYMANTKYIEDFLAVFGGFIKELSKLEKDKGIRERFWKEYQQEGIRNFTEEFTLQLKKVVSKRVRIKKENASFDNDYSVEYYLAFLDVLHTFQESDPEQFIYNVIHRINQIIDKKEVSEKASVAGLKMPYKKDALYHVMQLFDVVKQEKERQPSLAGDSGEKNAEVKEQVLEIIKMILGSDYKWHGYQYSKKEVKFLYELFVDDYAGVVCLDQQTGENGMDSDAGLIGEVISLDDGGSGEYNKSPEAVYIRKDNQKRQYDQAVRFLSVLTSEEVFRLFINKTERNFMKLFMTRSILILLKLRYYTDYEIEEYRRICENACEKQYGKASYKEHFVKLWKEVENRFETKLPGQELAYPTERPGKAGYYRYGETPAGDPEIYDALVPMEEALYRQILHGDYLERAIDGDSGELKNVYSCFLKEDFSFSNNEMAELEGCVDSTISKRYVWYRGKALPGLKELFMEQYGEDL